MKHRWKKALLLLALVSTTGISMLVSCKKDKLKVATGVPFNQNIGILKSSTPLLQVSFEMEMHEKTTKTGTGNSNYPELDLVTEMPLARRQKVTLHVMEDGTFSMVTESKTPNYPINIPHETEPNTAAVPVKVIMTNELMLVYDKNDKEIYNVPVQVPLMTDLVGQINAMGQNYSASVINQMIMNGTMQSFVQNLDDYLQNAAQNGIVVTDHGNNIYSAKELMSNAPFPVANPNDYAIHIFDRSRNLLLATGVYDESEVMKTRIMFSYEAGANPYLKAIRQESQETLPSGLAALTVATTQIEDLNITLNY